NGDGGSLNSQTANLIVIPTTILISQPPASIEKCDGQSASFIVEVSGDNIVYSWEKDGVALVDGANVSGSVNNILTISDISISDEAIYKCIITGTCQNVSTDPSTLNVNENTSVTLSPSDGEYCTEESITLSVASANPSDTYQWKKDGVDIIDDVQFSGATTSNLDIDSLNNTNAGIYSCLVTGFCDSQNSGLANIQVLKITQINIQPIHQDIDDGDPVSFTVSATGETLSYQWQKGGVDISDDANISGTNLSVLNISSVSTSDEGAYTCIVSGTCGKQISDPANLTVFLETLIITHPQPSDISICEGSPKEYSVTATGSNITYEWRKDGTAISDLAGKISGVTTQNLIISSLESSDQGVYTCVVSGDGGTLNSQTANLVVTQTTTLISQPPASYERCEGQSASFIVDVSGDGITYSWEKDGVALVDGGNIFGSGNNILTISDISISDEGIYKCIITGTCQNVSTDPSTLIVNEYPGTPGIIIGDDLICQGETGKPYEVSQISNADTYEWRIPSGVDIIGDVDTRNIVIDYTLDALSGVFSVHGKNACGIGPESAPLDVVVNVKPTANAGTDQNLCSNTATLNANTTSNGTWVMLSGNADFTDINLYNTDVQNLAKGSNTLEWTVSVNNCVSRDTVIIINNITDVDAGENQILCSSTSTLNANTPAAGTGSWSVVSGGANFDQPYSPITDVSSLSKGTNILKWTINNEGCIRYDTVSITNDLPTNAFAGHDIITLVDTSTIEGNTPAVGTGEWTLSSGSGIIVDKNSPTTHLTDLAIGENVFIWTITNNLCSFSDDVKVINSTITDNDAGSDQSLCTDNTFLFGTVPNYGVGTWSVVTGSAKFIDKNKYDTEVVEIGKSANVFRWTIQEYEVTTDEVTITNNSPTIADAGDDRVYCLDSTTLEGNEVLIGTGIWSIIGGSGNIEDEYQYNSKVTNISKGTNTFRWTITSDSGGCVTSDEVFITNDLPTIADAGLDQTICTDSVILYPNTPSYGTGSWEIIGGSATFINNTATKLSSGNNTFNWVISKNQCKSIDEIIITNNSPSQAYAGSDRTNCSENIFMSARDPIIGTGNWTLISGAADIIDPISNTSEVQNIGYGSNTFRWKIENLGCYSEDRIEISNNQPTNISAGLDQYLCADSAQLYSSEAENGYGTWTIAEGSGIFEDNTLFNSKVYSLERGQNKLVWTVTTTGCNNSDTVLVTNNLPSLPSAGPDQDNCISETFMAANIPQIGTGEWGIVSGSASFENATDPSTKITDIGYGENSFNWITTNGSCILSDEIIIKNSSPTIAYAGEDRIICNSTANLLANPPSIGDGIWRVVSGFGVIQNPNDFNAEITSLGLGANTLSWTTENGRCKTSDNVIITNNLAIAYAGIDEIVYDPNIILVGNNPAEGIGEWQLAAGLGNIASPNSFETQVTELGEGANTFYWTIDNDKCVAYDEVIITYYVLPEVDFTPTPQNGCPPLFVDFINSSVGGSPFTWDFGDGAISTDANPMHTYNIPGTYNVKLSGTGPDGIIVEKDTVVI
ncbi:MAG: immunoglobulin domain-containing protein, partial [Bacteroidales bacterium]|nr:immunoglobulin domain-containing protein [Bacteroidales bacterium]